MGLDAVISILLVMVAFQLFAGSSSTNPFEKLLENSGGIGATVDKLIDRVKSDDGDAYWLGAIPRTTNSVNQSVDGVEVVSYFPGGVSPQDAAKSILTVETFEDAQAYAHHVHLLTESETEKTVVTQGMKVEYDTNALDAMTIVFATAPEIVVVNYGTKQSETKLLTDAAQVRFIQ